MSGYVLEQEKCKKGGHKMEKEDVGYVFVYGTLKCGGGLAVDFDEYRMKSMDATINGVIYKGPFPLLKLNENGKVHGELHKFSNFKNVIKRMDQAEAYYKDYENESLYIRRTVLISVNGRVYEAYVYEFHGYGGEIKTNDFKKIESGIWELPKETVFDEEWREDNEEMES